MAEPLMPLAQAHDALSDLARQFYNDMLRDGVKELPASAWLATFRSWLPSGSAFAADDREEATRTEHFPPNLHPSTPQDEES